MLMEIESLKKDLEDSQKSHQIEVQRLKNQIFILQKSDRDQLNSDQVVRDLKEENQKLCQ